LFFDVRAVGFPRVILVLPVFLARQGYRRPICLPARFYHSYTHLPKYIQLFFAIAASFRDLRATPLLVAATKRVRDNIEIIRTTPPDE
jgi:hypothetical protein